MLSQFWTHVFEEYEGLAVKLSNLNACSSLVFDSTVYGPMELTFRPATSPGDNYMSEVFFGLAVTRNGAEHRAFIKVLPSNERPFNTCKALQLPFRETNVYKLLHTLLRDIRSAAGVESNAIPLNVPDVYYLHLDEMGGLGSNCTALVMQDMRYTGHRMVDRTVGCTAVDEVEAALSTLANFHALSMALIRTRWTNSDGAISPPPELEFLLKGTLYDNRAFSMLAPNIPRLVYVLTERGHRDAAVWLESETREHGNSVWKHPSVEECGPLLSVQHADCWSNNMLYRYDEHGRAVNMTLVDWQVPRLGHPGRDIANFLFTSTSPELRKEHRQHLLDHYFDVLSAAMEKLNLEKYDRRLFLTEVQKWFRFGLYAALVDITFKDIMDGTSTSEEKDARFLADEKLCHRLIAVVEEIRAVLHK